MTRYECGIHLVHALESLPTIRTSGADVLEELKVETEDLEVWVSHQPWGKEVLVLGRSEHPADLEVLETYEID